VFYAKELMVMEERRRIKTSGSMLAVGGTALTKTIVLRQPSSDSRRRTSRLCSRGLVQNAGKRVPPPAIDQSLRSLRQSLMRQTPTTENPPYRSRHRFPLGS